MSNPKSSETYEATIYEDDSGNRVERFHVYPVCDIYEHDASERCWCEPELNYRNSETGNEVWLHHRTQ